MITRAAVDSLQHNLHDFYLVNYANADVMARTGNFEATVQAVEFLDKQLGVLFEEVVVKRNGVLCVTSAHSSADYIPTVVKEKTGRLFMGSPVYFLLLKQNLENKQVELPVRELSDIAPFMAHMVFDQD